LSDDARIDTKPQLEIYADDVKCTHGATIGQIEENALFYLRSRGIDEISARKLLLLAFASECLERMAANPARDHVEQLIHGHLLKIANSTKNLAKLTTEDRDRNWEEIGGLQQRTCPALPSFTPQSTPTTIRGFAATCPS